ncbi:MAG TPA: aminotransferase class V-fold PLP-dependent enzyme [Bacteroidia bacterium]|nr:aminotransferase class V-fold PLP-dependent enzyme [Bacteroidia bacterium]
MNNNRRNFIKNTAKLSLIPLLGIDQMAARNSFALNRKIDFNEERDWLELRNKFPLSKDRIYFNNGTMGPSPFSVIDAVNKKMLSVDSNADYGGWEDSRKSLARFVKCEESEICLTHNVTEGINIICWALDLKAGDEILVTNHEHVGGALPWLNRAKLENLVVNYFELGKNATETLTNLKKKITAKTKVIAVPHIVCTIGQIQPIKEIVAIGKEKNIKVFVDGAHGTGMLNLNLKDLGCDYYASCCHKWLCGPKGTGYLYVKKEALNDLKAYYVGAGSDNGWNVVNPPNPLMTGYANTAHRFDYGTQNASIWAGVDAAITMWENIGMDKIEARVKYLATHLQNSLLKFNSEYIEMLTSTEPESRGAVVAFRLKNVEYTKFQTLASEAGFRVRVVPENGVNCIRVSTHIYNSLDEINQFVSFTEKMLKG